VILSAGADSESASSLSRASVATLMNAPGIRKDGGTGRPLAAAEVLAIATVTRKSNGSDAFVTLRGTSPSLLAVRQDFRLASGRMFRPAVSELLVGEAAARQFAGLEVGSAVRLADGDWTVVGIFTSGGSSHESSLLADEETLLSAYRRNAFNSMVVRLDSPESFRLFKDAISADPSLHVDVYREAEFFAAVSAPLNRVLRIVAYLIGAVMAIGALFGALNTMYSAVDSRSAEIATLRALGFRGFAIVVALLIEAALLALVGAAVGVLLVLALLDGRTISTIGDTVGNNPQLVYSLALSPGLVMTGVVLAVSIGLVGGLFPAARAARLPITAVLRQ
jgi:putative ABC transport system permease protein